MTDTLNILNRLKTRQVIEITEESDQTSMASNDTTMIGKKRKLSNVGTVNTDFIDINALSDDIVIDNDTLCDNIFGKFNPLENMNLSQRIRFFNMMGYEASANPNLLMDDERIKNISLYARGIANYPKIEEKKISEVDLNTNIIQNIMKFFDYPALGKFNGIKNKFIHKEITKTKFGLLNFEGINSKFDLGEIEFKLEEFGMSKYQCHGNKLSPTRATICEHCMGICFAKEVDRDLQKKRYFEAMQLLSSKPGVWESHKAAERIQNYVNTGYYNKSK